MAETKAKDFLSDVKQKRSSPLIPHYDSDDSSGGSSFGKPAKEEDDDWISGAGNQNSTLLGDEENSLEQTNLIAAPCPTDVNGDGLINIDDLLHQLIKQQYVRNDLVVQRGSFRLKGDTLDIFPVYEETIFRIEFFGDEVEDISRIDPTTGEIM